MDFWQFPYTRSTHDVSYAHLRRLHRCDVGDEGPLPKPERLSLSRESCRRAAAASAAKKDPPGVSMAGNEPS